MLQTGKDEKGIVLRAPVFVMKPKQDGFVEMKMIGDQNDVIQIRGQPLQALAYYQQQLAARHKDIIDEQGKIDELQKQLAALTDEMQGPKGLIVQKAIQVDARIRAVAQQEYLKPSL